MSIEKRTENFLKKSRRKYAKTFNYSEMIYTNLNTQIKLQCKTHDFSFSIKPQNHLKQKYGGCKKCKESINNFVVSDRRNFEVVFTCGHTFLTFCGLLDLNTLFKVDSYANKNVTEYVEKTKQEGSFCYVNKVFFKKYAMCFQYCKQKRFTDFNFSIVASYGNLSLMKWLREKNCPWSEETFSSAAANGNFENMKWLREEKCPWSESTFYESAKNGNLETMKWLREEECPWTESVFSVTAYRGNLGHMKWLREEKCPWIESTFSSAATNGNLENMKWLKEEKCPWGARTFESAAENGNLKNMKWLREQGCLWNRRTFAKIVLNKNWGIKWRRYIEGDISYGLYDTENKVLESIKWLKEQGCPWGPETFQNAAEIGILQNMKWLREKGCPWNEETFYKAAENGNLDNMKWLREEGCPWNEQTFNIAVRVSKNLENLEWLKAQRCPWNKEILFWAIWNSSHYLEVMQWLLENGCIWNYEVFCTIVQDSDIYLFRPLVEDGCITSEEYEEFFSHAVRDGIILKKNLKKNLKRRNQTCTHCPTARSVISKFLNGN